MASYMWANTSAVYDIPSGSSDYMVFTDTVPFMQMALKGYIDYYGTRSNFHADRQKDMLHAIEYGEFPSWMVTWEDSIKLLNTASTWLYTSAYSIWKEEIIEEYQTLNAALTPVRNACMINHEMVMDEVAAVTYDNGVKIFVNYSSDPVTVEGTLVDALGYAIVDHQ